MLEHGCVLSSLYWLLIRAITAFTEGTILQSEVKQKMDGNFSSPSDKTRQKRKQNYHFISNSEETPHNLLETNIHCLF